jgi:hypothetical protein
MARRGPISRQQWAALADRLAAEQLFLHRLRRRLKARGVPHDDPIYRTLEQASAAMQSLRTDAHYRGTSGTGHGD